MKLSLIECLNEISQRAGVSRDPLLLKLNLLSKQPNTYIHFTNEPNKVGFNPKPNNTNYIDKNPRGYYGFPLKQFMERLEETGYLSHDRERYIVVFAPKDGLNLYQANDFDKTYDMLAYKPGTRNTMDLMKQGYDGVLSSNSGMSGDITDEIVIFRPSNVKVLMIAPNSIADEMMAQKLMQRKRNARMDNQDPEAIQNSIDYRLDRGRDVRKRNPI